MDRILKTLVKLLFDRALPSLTEEEAAYLSELKTTFRKIPPFERKNCQPSEVKWTDNMNLLRECVLAENPREFLRWDVIKETMFIEHAHYIHKELSYLKSLPDWNSRWRQAINETTVGRPAPYFFYPKSSCNLIHHAYHLAVFENEFNCRIDKDTFVFEFGGGYGNMCRLLFNLGFKGKYLIFDLPCFSSLQTYFLKTSGFPALSTKDFIDSDSGICCVSSIDQLEPLLLDQGKNLNNVFLATWSISEAPTELRGKLFPMVSNFESFLIAYQDRFEENDNLAYFNEWTRLSPLINWKNIPIRHIPGNHYLFGQRNVGQP